MAPISITPGHSNGDNSSPMVDQINGHDAAKQGDEASLLERFEDDDVHDLICVGFGPASLAIAVALHDALENENPRLRTRCPKVRFLERQAAFAWHAGMLLQGAKMQITFIKDMATLRNPRSEFTFLNYLHRQGRLVPFTNLGTFLPQRMEYEKYMRWCASHFADVVDYNQDVDSVGARRVQSDSSSDIVHCFEVKSRDRLSGKSTTRLAKNVVIAAGGKPNIPECLRINHPRIIHSSQYATNVSDLFPSGTEPRSVAVIGAGQSAAEVFHNIPSRFPDAKTYLLIRGSALRPSDDSPFVNEIFDPERVDDVYHQDSQIRADGIALDRATNYSVVRLQLLEEIYSILYSYRIQNEKEDEWPQQILPYRSVTGVTESLQRPGALQLQIENHSGEFKVHKQSKRETLDVDLVVVASGYRRDAHVDMLRGLEYLRSGSREKRGWEVARDYRVRMEQSKVAPDAGIWLQGCNESTHGLSDTLLSILATRGGEMVKNIFGSDSSETEEMNGSY